MAAPGYAVRDRRIAGGWVVGDGGIVGGVELPRAAAAPDPGGGMRCRMNGMETAAVKASAMKATGAKPAAVEASTTAIEAAHRSAAETASAVETASATMKTAATAAMESAAAVTSATGCQRRIRGQRRPCCSRENCDERQPREFPAHSSGHVGSRWCQNIQ